MSRRIGLIASLLVLIAFCGLLFAQATPRPRPVTVADYEHIAKLRKQAAALVLEQMELSWQRRTTGAKVDIAATYEGHEKLFSRDTVALLDRAIAGTRDADKQKALRFFRRYVLSEMVAMRVAKLDDEVAAMLADAEFTYNDKTYNYYQYGKLVREETEYDQRQTISDAVVPILQKANALYRKKEERAQRLAKDLGFADYVALSETLRHVDMNAFAVTCRQFLDMTEADYKQLLRWAVPFQLGFPAEKLRRCDMGRLFMNVRYDKYFTKNDMTDRMTRFLGGLGLSIKPIKIDDADRPKKNPRAACYPMVVPDDVRLTIKPVGGQSDYSAFWHEMGHAQHFANADTDVWEFQQLGDYVTTESYAFLFDSLMGNRLFLERYIDMHHPDVVWHVRYAGFIKLFMVRRYCAKVLYEMELHRGVADPAERYRYWLGRAYGIPLDANDGERHLTDVDDFFYSADYTRAWMVEAMLENRLTERYGNEWFANPDAGAFLKKLWKTGQYYSGDELIKQLGYPALDPQYLISRIKRRARVK